MQFPTLGTLQNGADEPIFAWYGRCHLAVSHGRGMALAHKAGDLPYLKLYGTVNGTTFTPFAPLSFPIEQGVIAELGAPTCSTPHGCRGAMACRHRPPASPVGLRRPVNNTRGKPLILTVACATWGKPR